VTGSCGRRRARDQPKPRLQRIVTQSIDVASTNSLMVAAMTFGMRRRLCAPCQYTRARASRRAKWSLHRWVIHSRLLDGRAWRGPPGRPGQYWLAGAPLCGKAVTQRACCGELRLVSCGQGLICCGPPLARISILRGLARSAIGIFKVSTPAS
jgi:hypothetical protein